MNIAFLSTCFFFSVTDSISPSPWVPSQFRNKSSLTVYFKKIETSYEGDILSYEIWYRTLLNSTWIPYSSHSEPESIQDESQIVSIRVDHNKELNKGTFTLGLVRSQLNPLSIDDEARTPEISWNADAIEFKKAVSYLAGVKVKEVRRCDQFENESFGGRGGSEGWFHGCPYQKNGGYRWLVIFDVPINSLPVPLLYAFRNNLGWTWTGPGEQISITRIEKGWIHPQQCLKDTCFQTINNLLEGSLYSFKIRAFTAEDGWTDFSASSTFVSTLENRIPNRPRPPKFLTNKVNSLLYNIDIESLMSPAQDISLVESQIRRKREISSAYNNDNNNIVEFIWKDGPTLNITHYRVASTPLVLVFDNILPDTAYEVRIRAVNSVGKSPFSTSTSGEKTRQPSESETPPEPIISPQSVSANQISVTVIPSAQSLNQDSKDDHRLQYQLQYRSVSGGGGLQADWLNHPETIQFQQKQPVQTQEIEIRSDTVASGDCSGYFWLSLGSVDYSDVSQSVIGPFPFHLSAEDLRSSIVNLMESRSNGGDAGTSSSSSVVVYRRANRNNGYIWSVEFHDHPNPPLIQLQRQNLTSFVEVSYTATVNATLNTSSASIQTVLQDQNLTSNYTITKTLFRRSPQSCWTGAGPIVNTRVVSPPSLSLPADRRKSVDERVVIIGGLQPESVYEFRIRNILPDTTEGGQVSKTVTIKTKPELSSVSSTLLGSQNISGLFHLESANGSLAARKNDRHYIAYSGDGGSSGADGQPGHCWVGSFNPNLMLGTERISSQIFFHTGKVQTYTVPRDAFNPRLAIPVTVKCWGGGGAGGKLTVVAGKEVAAGFSSGGGGAFAEATIWLAEGKLDIFVGGGGRASPGEEGGYGGAGGGGEGGKGIGGYGGGGGGGATVVRILADIVLVAAGGGGGGSTDYCCGSGGGGGGYVGSNGSFPGDNTPWPITSPDSPTPVIRRFEYTSSSCPDGPEGQYCISEWDIKPHSLPAHHRHLDYGRHPGGNYTIWASSGSGGGESEGGSGGVTGSLRLSAYKGGTSIDMGSDGRVAVYSISEGLEMRAKYGSFLSGGSGADGFDAGGGGGGGYYGGGGGGSGIDGAGGGGGSSYVNTNTSFLSAAKSQADTAKDKVIESEPEITAPVVSFLNTTAANLEWTLNSLTTSWGNALRYEIELAEGSSSDDFQLKKIVYSNSKDMMFIYYKLEDIRLQYGAGIISALKPGTWYRSRIIPIFGKGRGAASSITKFQTQAGPSSSSYWERVVARRYATAAIGRGLSAPVTQRPHLDPQVEIFHDDTSLNPRRTSDPKTSLTAVEPSRRRGHTLSLISDQIYMFGGRTDGYSCADAYKDTLNLGTPESGRNVYPCETFHREVNEVWKFDINTYEWKLLQNSSNLQFAIAPNPREQHSTAVFGDSLYVFGGRTKLFPSLTDVIYNDMWRFNIPPTITTIVLNSTGQVNISQTSLTFSEINGSASSLLDEIGDGVDRRVGMVIESLRIKVSVEHSCSSQLRISLMGPGRRTGSANYFPASSSNEVLLFDQSVSNNSDYCVSGVHTFEFSDSAVTQLDVCCPKSFHGEFRPLGRLSEFVGTTPAAHWTLTLQDTNDDGFSGKLLDWSIIFELSPSTKSYSWTNLTPSVTGTVPSPRHRAMIITLNDYIFIYGGVGVNGVILDDLYRFQVENLKWERLTPAGFDIALNTASAIGSSFVLSPFGLIRFGGYSRDIGMITGQSIYNNDVYVFNPFTLKWSYMEINDIESAKLTPIARYLSAAVFVPRKSLTWVSNLNSDESSSIHNVNLLGKQVFSLFLFGGDPGASGSLEDGSDGGLLNDGWMLRFSELSLDSIAFNQLVYMDQECSWRSSTNADFTNGRNCLGPPDSVCNLRDLLIIPSCSGKIQTLL